MKVNTPGPLGKGSIYTGVAELKHVPQVAQTASGCGIWKFIVGTSSTVADKEEAESRVADQTGNM